MNFDERLFSNIGDRDGGHMEIPIQAEPVIAIVSTWPRAGIFIQEQIWLMATVFSRIDRN